MRFMAGLLAAGNEAEVVAAYKKLMAVRLFKRAEAVGDIDSNEVSQALAEAQMTAEDAAAIYRLTSLATFRDRFVIPPMAREIAIETLQDPFTHKKEAGTGFLHKAKREW